jgi:hypothetical protein
MGSGTLYLLFNYDAGKELNDASRIAEMVRALVANGEFLVSGPGDSGDSSRIKPEDLIRAAWEWCIEQGRHGVSMNIIDPRGFSMPIGISFDNYRWLYVFIDGGAISDPHPSNYQNIKSMVRAAEIIYRATYPYYGFGLSSPNTFRHPGPDDRDANVDTVWDYNFFGPKLAETFGREVLLSVPTWRTLEFDDGGFLLEMARNPIVNWKEAVRNYESAVRILGLRTFHQGG